MTMTITQWKGFASIAPTGNHNREQFEWNKRKERQV